MILNSKANGFQSRIHKEQNRINKTIDVKPRTCIHWQTAHQNRNNNQNNSSNRKKSHNIATIAVHRSILHSRCALKFIHRHFCVCVMIVLLFFLLVLLVCANIIRFYVSNMSHIVHGPLSTSRFVHAHVVCSLSRMHIAINVYANIGSE